MGVNKCKGSVPSFRRPYVVARGCEGTARCQTPRGVRSCLVPPGRAPSPSPPPSSLELATAAFCSVLALGARHLFCHLSHPSGQLSVMGAGSSAAASNGAGGATSMQSAGPTSGSSGDVGENYSKYESPFDAGNGSTHFLMIPIESTMKTVRCACAVLVLVMRVSRCTSFA